MFFASMVQPDGGTLEPLGLKEAKDLIEGVPKPVKQSLSREEPEKILKAIEEAGGKAEIK